MNKKLHVHLARMANQGTRLIAVAAGRSIPFYYVAEYPRSGGTWIAHLLSDYLQIPFPKHSMLPIACKSVIHNHWSYHRNLDKPVYVVRDGRDIAVSMMFYALRRFRTENYYAKRFPSLYQVSGNNQKHVFEQFLRDWFAHPVGCRLSWDEHVQQWTTAAGVFVVKYEDFNRDAFVALRRLLLELEGLDADEELVDMAVQKYSFERQTKRAKGQEDKTSDKRKGVVGDWRNYFTRPAAEYFHKKAGHLLLELGYEDDPNWFERIG